MTRAARIFRAALGVCGGMCLAAAGTGGSRRGPVAAGAGQSRIGNYGPMSGLHHRLKTHGGWDVEQPFLQAKRVGRADSIRKDVEDSLRRLQVERIDLMQVHWPAEDGSPIEEYWGELVKLRDEGKLRAIGLSNHDAAALERAEAIGHVDSLQPPFSMIRREALADILPWCATHDTGVIVYSPMQSGLLTGAFDRERVAGLDPKDWRSRNPEFTTNLDKNMALVERLRSVADRLGCSPGEVALAWVLTHDAVTGAIVGARRPDQVDGWIGGADVTLDEATLAELADALTATGAGAGPLD